MVLTVAALMAAMMVASAMPALADAVPPPSDFGGPPAVSGDLNPDHGNGAQVFHCKAFFPGSQGTMVFHNGDVNGTCQPR
jgi:hypothetical protein